MTSENAGPAWRRVGVQAALGLLCTFCPAAGQSLRLLGDLNAAPATGFSFPEGPTLGEEGSTLAYFVSGDPLSGIEVWRTDGTVAGTAPLGDVTSFRPNFIGVAGDTAVFESNLLLVSSPGTPGVFDALLSRYVSPSRNSINAWLPHARRDGLLFFGASNLGEPAVLHVTDGSPGGTRELYRTQPGPTWSWSLAATPTKLFAGVQAPNFSRSLLVSTGDPSGPASVVRTFPAGTLPPFSVGFGWLTPVGDSVAFIAPDNQLRPQIWLSDGTASGTIQLSAFVSFNPGVSSPTWNGSRIAFLGPADANAAGPAIFLWLSDGTPQGTARAGFTAQLAAPIGFPILTPDTPRSPIVHLNSVFALVSREFQDPFGGRLYVGDGSAEGTTPIDTGDARVIEFIHVARTPQGDIAYFLAQGPQGVRLWRTDATPAGTWMIDAIPGAPIPTDLRPLATLDGALILATRTPPSTRYAVWRTDGTPEGTYRIAGEGVTRLPDLGSNPTGFAVIGGEVTFGATSAATGTERYRATAAVGSARACEESILGADNNAPPEPVVIGQTLYTRATTRIDVEGVPTEVDAVFATTDPAQLGEPVYLAPAPFRVRDLAGMQGVLYFAAPAEGTGEDNTLWRSEGTAASTRPVVADLKTRPLGVVSAVHEWNGVGYLIARTIGSPTYGLWRTDGTPEGTFLLREFTGASSVSSPRFAAASQKLYFSAYEENFNRLWETDGTAKGTRVVAPDVAIPVVATPSFASLGDRLVTAGTRTGDETDLWMTSPDEAGLVPVTSTAPGAATLSSLTTIQTPAGERVVFVAGDVSRGTELWSTDATPAGTDVLRDIWPGPFSSSPTQLRGAGDRLYFSAATGHTGRELFVTDGTAGGTRLLMEVNPGPTGSAPTPLLADTGVVYMSAVDATLGREPYAIRLDPCAADFNSDDTITSQDFFAYLTAFFTQSPGADFNADGAVNSQDFFEFLGAFFQGCA